MSLNLASYHEANVQQVFITNQLLKSAVDIFAKKKFNNVKLIDIGSGDGRVLVEIFMEKSGINFCNVMGTDKRKDAVEFARNTYGSDEIRFEVLDIENGSEKNLAKFTEDAQFDLATSFFVLHYMTNFDKVFANINKLLKPDGSFYFNFIISSTVCDIFRELAEDRPNFKAKFESYLPIMAKINDFRSELPMILEKNDFKIDFLDFETIPFDYESEKLAKERLSASIPILYEMDKNSLDEFFDDFMKVNKSICEGTGKKAFEFNYVHAHGMITKKK